MPKREELSAFEEQKQSKPNIDSMINNFLESDLAADALDFVSFIKSYKMTPHWYATDSFSVSYKNKRVCIIKIHDGRWWLWLYSQYDEDFNNHFANKDFNEVIIKNLVYCQNCNICVPGKDADIMGNDYHNICCFPVVRIKNPNAEELNYAKELVILRRMAIQDDKVPNVNYVPIKKRNDVNQMFSNSLE